MHLNAQSATCLSFPGVSVSLSPGASNLTVRHVCELIFCSMCALSLACSCSGLLEFLKVLLSRCMPNPTILLPLLLPPRAELEVSALLPGPAIYHLPHTSHCTSNKLMHDPEA